MSSEDTENTQDTENTAVIAVDATGTVTLWPPAAEDLFGHRADDILGKDVAMIVPDELRAAHDDAFARAMTGAPTRATGIGVYLPVRHADGRVIVAAGRLDVLRAPDGEPVGAVATFRRAEGEPVPFTPTAGRWPAIRRIVANLPAADPSADAGFWTELFGIETRMDHGWVANHADARSGAEIQVMSADASAPVNPAVSVEVRDGEMLRDVHDRAVAAGLEIVHPMTDEPWGVRRFFVRTPQGSVINVLTHR